MKIPRNGTKALLILERTDNEGIYPLMNLLLKTFVNDTFGIEKGFSIEKTNIVLGTYMEELTSGRYKSLTLTANRGSSDTANRYFGNLETTDYSMELVVKFKNNLGAKKETEIKRLINSGDTLFEIPELNTIFDNTNKKVESVVGSGKSAKTRTLYLNNERNELIHPYYDLSVESNEKGFSLYRSIKEKTREFIYANTEFEVFN